MQTPPARAGTLSAQAAGGGEDVAAATDERPGAVGLAPVSPSPVPSRPGLCVIDFTPYATETHLYVVLVHLYWVYIYTEAPLPCRRQHDVDWAAVTEWLVRYDAATPFTSSMVDLLHVSLVKVAVRMIFTVVFFAEEHQRAFDAGEVEEELPAFVSSANILRCVHACSHLAPWPMPTHRGAWFTVCQVRQRAANAA